MTIKNPHIIHFIRRIKKEDDYLKKKWHYLCVHFYTKEKSTRKESEVTCKNCLKELKKEQEDLR